MKYVKWFEEIKKDDVSIAGGKGANLGEMTRAGFPIPPGFVILTNAYFEFIEKTGIKGKIKKILDSINYSDIKDLEEKTKEIRDLIINSEIPKEIESEILEAYDKLGEKIGEKEPLIIVRSSATAEDIATASFAGQLETFFNIKKDQLIEFVKRCWASLFTARVTFYRHEKGFDHMKVGIAVIVQKMLRSEISGVAFTKHPVTGEDIIIIEAVYGIGEGIVSGRYTPDHYEVDPRNWKIIKKEIAEQEKMLVFKEGFYGENIEVDVPEEKKKKQKLPDDMIIELAKICRKIEKHYGIPQDIEWAVEKGKIYIVQSRPITTIRGKMQKEAKIELKPILKGLPASPGITSGPVKLISDISELDKIKKGDILVTTMTNPDMVPAMKKAAAIVTDEGGLTSHAAIVSRELGIPCVVGTKEATKKLKDGMVVTVDGSRGFVYLGDVTSLLRKKVAEKYLPEEEEKIFEIIKEIREKVFIPTATKVMVNISNPDIAERIAQKNVDGVGLLRAEFMVANIGIHPKYAIETGRREEFVKKLAEGIAKIARAFYPRPVIYRSFDFKTNEYRELEGGEKYEPIENNPMIGYRGAVRAIRDRDVFEIELDALKIVREEYGLKNVWLMMPFVRKVKEIKEIKKILEEKGFFKDDTFKFFMMAEVPSNVLLIEEFLEYVDGISIGTNDLTQLILGIDRDSPILAEEFDELDPAVIKALEILIKTTKKKGKYVSICGQAPTTRPEIIEYLIRFGIDSISVNPDAIERTREFVASIERKIILEKLRGK